MSLSISKTYFKAGALVLAAVIGVYAFIYADVVLRAKQSYSEAETYMDWHSHPEKKKAYFDEKFQIQKAALDAGAPDYKQKLEALEFDRDTMIGESSLKYAYQWYKDTYELFSPPESKWTASARAKTPQVLEMWKQELREQKVPFDDTSFE